MIIKLTFHRSRWHSHLRYSLFSLCNYWPACGFVISSTIEICPQNQSDLSLEIM